MQEDSFTMEKAKPFDTVPMLLDCYTELIAYTGYLLKQIQEGKPAYESVAKTYETLVQRSRDFAKAAGFSEDKWQEGFFAVCAYIDEAVLCTDWEDRLQWERSQLQRRHFNTTSAGGAFYERLEKLDASSRDIREVYEFCLTLGFKGRYYQASDIGKLEDIQYTHLKQVTDNVDLIFPESLFPDAYEPDTSATKRKKRKWKRVSLFSPAVVLLPILLFVALYYFFDRYLNDAVHRYFGAGF